MSLKYGIYPPRFAGNSLYYKDIVVMVIEDDELIGAFKYDYKGNKVPVATSDLVYKQNNAKTHFTNIQEPSKNIIDSVVRTIWTFDDEKSAFIQKLILLEHIRNYFYQKQKEERLNFDTKIPKEISDVVKEHRRNNPEYFL